MFNRYRSIPVVAVVLTLLLGACAPAATKPTVQPATATSTSIPVTPTATPLPVLTYEETLPLFHYDSSTPFEVNVLSEEEKDGVIIQDLTYMAADPSYTPHTAGRVVAYLVKPSKSGSYAGVLYMHGLGTPWPNRKAFLDEAVKLAHQGVVSLLPIGLFPWIVTHSRDGATDQMSVIKQVDELRRSVDFLLAQPGVDAQRLAFVGADYGAMHGSVLAGVEKRIKAYVLITGDNDYTHFAILFFAKPIDPIRYKASLDAVAPLAFVPHAAPAALFFQYGGADGFVTQETANALYNAASEPKKFGWYDKMAHNFYAQATQERLDWLALELSLKPAP